MTGGDLPTSITSVTASECWNTSFALVYSTIDPAAVDPTRIAGDPSQCAFAELSLPGLP